MAEDWDALASLIGFDDEEQMLRHMYTVDHFSISQISMKLGTGTTTIIRRLELYGIERRKKGGPNNYNKQRLRLHLLDQRLLWTLSPMKVAKMLHVHPSTVWKYKKGARDAVLHNQPDKGAEPVFDTRSRSLSTSTYREQGIHRILPADEREG